jgi:formiminoglutamase
VEYIVPLKQLDYQLTFWKSKRSGRWWLQVPVKTKKQHQRHRLIPCSYEDYQLAGQDQLPDRLLEAFRRFP